MIQGLTIGIFAGIAIIIAIIISKQPVDYVRKPDLDAELTPEQAIRQLQEIKPYFAYKGRTWTALDMGIKAIQEKEDKEANGKNDSI